MIFSIGLLALNILFNSVSIVYQTTSGIYYIIKNGSKYVYKKINPDKHKYIENKKDFFQIIEKNKIDDNIKSKLIEEYGDDFIILTNKND